MKRVSTVCLALVAVLDVVFLFAVFSGTLFPSTLAQEDAATESTESESGPRTFPNRWSDALIQELGAELARRSEALAARERELDELLLGAEVLRLAESEDEADPDAADAAGGDAPGAAADAADAAPAVDPEVAAREQAAALAFDRLQKTYAAMEPTTAAQALQALTERDKQAVVQLLITWQPRVSGAILDELTLLDATLAADLSYEIWTMRGKK